MSKDMTSTRSVDASGAADADQCVSSLEAESSGRIQKNNLSISDEERDNRRRRFYNLPEDLQLMVNHNAHTLESAEIVAKRRKK